MMVRGMKALALALGVCWVGVLLAQQAKAPVPTKEPKGWRDWTHITTGVI
jgi:hypothetical protein